MPSIGCSLCKTSAAARVVASMLDLLLPLWQQLFNAASSQSSVLSLLDIQLPMALHQVEEQRVSGGVNLNYFHEPIGSLYQGLGNVMLRIEPSGKQAAGNTTVLLNAHYDSTLGSPGTRAYDKRVTCAFRLAQALSVLGSCPSRCSLTPVCC